VGEEYRSWGSSLWSFLHSPVTCLYIYIYIEHCAQAGRSRVRLMRSISTARGPGLISRSSLGHSASSRRYLFHTQQHWYKHYKQLLQCYLKRNWGSGLPSNICSGWLLRSIALQYTRKAYSILIMHFPVNASVLPALCLTVNTCSPTWPNSPAHIIHARLPTIRHMA
jgi:hypothetical protein